MNIPGLGPITNKVTTFCTQCFQSREMILAQRNGFFLISIYYSSITQQHCLGVKNKDSKFSLPELKPWASYLTSLLLTMQSVTNNATLDKLYNLSRF